MPTKITPLPKTGGGGGGGGGAGGGKSGTKATTKSAVGKKPRFFNTSRFSSATAGLSQVAATRGKGYLQAIVFTACLGLGMLILGSVLVHLGDEHYIVDIMVLGVLFIVMGVGSLVVGCIYIIRPIYKERSTQKKAPQERRSALPSNSTPDYINPAFVMREMPQPQPTPGTSASVPVADQLYDRESLKARGAALGKLIPPSPPPVAHALKGREGTTSTILTTTVTDPDEMSDVTDEANSVR